ncbi:phage protein [Enterococcus sp. C1]|uniref:hypothetical protein n=1 Tax=Enterococcus sp. C1 TaxID=1182762 RepID=UPI000271DC9B|nr:hypothetical protein [Enterococcus sp. C1]EJF48911.1 phage protein [Enterococcus sp. C1]
MNIETRVYQLLSGSSVLIQLLENLRLEPFVDGENGIWKHEIPSLFCKKEHAPFLRISPIFESDGSYFDDAARSEEQRVLISFWCHTDTEAYQIKRCIDQVLKSNEFTHYTANENPRYKDTDIDLLMNNRKYRFFDWKNNEEE